MDFSNSKKLYKLAQNFIPGGVNSPVRAFKAVGMEPFFVKIAKGSRIIDEDDNNYIDYVNSWGALIFGHADDDILEVLNKTLKKGTSFGIPTQSETELAHLVVEFFPFVDMVRMTNSGTEAVMGAIRVARGYKSRSKIIKFNGCYHGHSDYLLVKAGSGATTFGYPNSQGVPNDYAKHTICLEFNDVQAVKDAVQDYGSDIAAIILEPVVGNMGLVMPQPRFLQNLREICDQHEILLIFDEVMTGFRVSANGASGFFGVEPDIIVLGKILGGGLPIGCFGAREDIMKNLAPLGAVYQAGTLSGNPLAMAAGIATLKKLKDATVYKKLENNAELLVNGLIKEATARDINFYALHCGAMLGFGFANKAPANYEQALESDTEYYGQIFRQMLQLGVYFPPSQFEALFLSYAHSQKDINETIDAFGKSLDVLCDQGIFPLNKH